MILIGSFMSIIVTKMCFGGIGCNIFNPALVGRVFLFISFPVQMTVWPTPHFLSLFSPDGSTGATTLRMLKSINTTGEISSEMYTLDELPSYLDMFLGNINLCKDMQYEKDCSFRIDIASFHTISSSKVQLLTAYFPIE